MQARRRGKSYELARPRWYVPLMFLLPAMLVMVAMVAYPLYYEVDISFRSVTLYNLRSGNYPWIGLENYKSMFEDPQFFSTLMRTVVWTVVNVVSHVTLGFMLALILNRKLPGKAIIRVLLILPWAVPQYIAAIAMRNLFNEMYGPINIVLKALFGEGAMVMWLSNPANAFKAAVITNIWLGVPFMMMTCLGGLQSIPQELYEAADIDGAGWWQKVRNVILPLMKPVLTPAIVLGTIWTFNMVNVIYILTYGSTHEAAQILVSQIYKRAFEFFRYGYAAAMSVVVFILLVSFSSVFIRAQKLED
ncbi:MAG: Maltose transport system permease protein MalF [Firmicutes bacterium ADurb.Bin153]|nr:MAG: Maltose transport system permease protein MalF [Firmicutes bacterium ADurb.Bin153]